LEHRFGHLCAATPFESLVDIVLPITNGVTARCHCAQAVEIKFNAGLQARHGPGDSE
jgi:hypothetical protein